MNILLIVGSGVQKSNTELLAVAFQKGAEEAGHKVDKIHLGSLNIADCRGCGACQRNGNHCAIRDDMQNLYEHFAACDAVVFASPLYFGSITGRVKNFIDRLYAISVKDQYPKKKTALLMTAGDDKSWSFDLAVRYYHMLTQVFGGHDMGMCLQGGCTGCEENERKMPDGALERAFRFGRSLS